MITRIVKPPWNHQKMIYQWAQFLTGQVMGHMINQWIWSILCPLEWMGHAANQCWSAHICTVTCVIYIYIIYLYKILYNYISIVCICRYACICMYMLASGKTARVPCPFLKMYMYMLWGWGLGGGGINIRSLRGETTSARFSLMYGHPCFFNLR